MECLGYKKSEVHRNAPRKPPWPASKRTGEAQYPTFCVNCKTASGGSLAPPLWDTDACARPVPSGTKQKCKAKVKEKSSSVTCHDKTLMCTSANQLAPPPPDSHARAGTVQRGVRHDPDTASRRGQVPCPHLANSRVSARRSPRWGGGGGDGRQVTVSQGGGGDCKGISRQTVVPSTDASTCAPSVREWYRTWSPGENILGLK